jgi:hypothetical protein
MTTNTATWREEMPDSYQLTNSAGEVLGWAEPGSALGKWRVWLGTETLNALTDFRDTAMRQVEAHYNLPVCPIVP